MSQLKIYQRIILKLVRQLRCLKIILGISLLKDPDLNDLPHVVNLISNHPPIDKAFHTLKSKKLHLKFCKYLLGVAKQATNESLYILIY